MFLTVIIFIVPTVRAADSTPSAAVKDKLQTLQTEIASKAAKLKTEISKRLQNKAYIGVIKSKSATTLTLAGRSGTKLVNINQDTVYEPIKKIKDEESIAALGDIDENGVLTARKVVILPATTQVKTILWGSVVSGSDRLLTIQDKSGKNIAVSTVKVTKAKNGQFVIITGYTGKNDILASQFIYIIPGKQAPVKVATPSAEATPSAD